MKAKSLTLFCFSILLCSACNPPSDIIKTVVGIVIDTPPSKVAYQEGNTFDPSGLVIKEKMNDGSIGKVVTDYTYSPSGDLTVNDTEITFSYKNFSVKQSITVSDINIVSQIKTFADGRTYLEVDGKPFSIKGGQLRVDGLINRSPYVPEAPAKLTYAEMEKYFIAAKNAHLNTLELGIQWADIEPIKDEYHFELVDNLLTFANKYNLKVEILWFASNMCGDSHSYQVPSYIFNNPEEYPQLSAKVPAGYSNMYGYRTFIKVDEPKYQERETKVAKALMDHIYSWNKANGKKNPVIGIQVHNEADGLVRWRRNQREITDGGEELISYNKLWNMTLSGLNNAGKAFKSSKYKIYTRCNMTTSMHMNEFPECEGTGISPVDVLNLEGIDIVGTDPYITNPSGINKAVRNYQKYGNYAHVAENMGNYDNSAALFLTAYQAGGSYMFYDLATPEYFIYINGGSSYQMDQGLYKPDLTNKGHTEETINIISGISKMNHVLPTIKSADFAAFNVNKETISQTLTQTICTSHYQVTSYISNGAVAFAIERGEYLYLCASKDMSMSLDNGTTALYADEGYFDENDEFVSEAKMYPTDKMYLSAGKLYKIKVTKILNEVTSTADANV